MNINTAIYVRVSTEEQALNGFSIRAQKEKLMYYATKIKDWNVYKIYSDEGISGKNIENRPSLLEMINDIKNRRVNNVLVFKIDRLTRSTKDLIDLIELFNNYDCDFNSLNESIDTSSATGRMFIKIIGIFAEFERENIVERVKLGFERKVREGNSICSCTPPLGYNRPKGSNNLLINKKETIIVKEIFNYYLNNKSIPDIVKILNNKNIKTKKNKQWTYKTIKLILTNPTYIGKVRYGINQKYYFEQTGNHKPIISINDYNKVQNKLSKKQITDAYYSHILKCQCGKDMVTKRIYKNKKVYINYRCIEKNKTCNKDISHLKLDKMLISINPNWKHYSLEQKNTILQNNIELRIENNTLKSNYNLSNL